MKPNRHRQDIKPSVITALRARPWMTVAELSKATGIAASRLGPSLLEYKFVQRKEDRGPKNRKVFRWALADEKSEPVAEVPTVSHAVPSISPPAALDAVVKDLVLRTANEITAVILKQFEDLPALIAQQLTPALAQVPLRVAEKIAPKPKQKRVAIVGIRPNQAGLLSQEFGACLDLRMFSPDDNLRLMQSGLGSADVVFVMAGQISHKHTEAVRAAGVVPVNIHGGMTALKDKLTELYVDES